MCKHTFQLASVAFAAATAAASGFGQDMSTEPSPGSRFAGWSPYLDIQLQARYDGIAISEFNQDWRRDFSPRAGRNVLFQRNHANAGLQKDRWFFGYDIRQDALLVTDDQTLELVRRIKQHDRPDIPVSYDLNAHMTSWRAEGVQFGRWFSDSPNQPTFLFSIGLYGKPAYRNNQITGSLSATPPDQLTADLQQRDVNTGAALPFQRGGASGSGITFSAGLRLPVTQSLTASLIVEDLFSRISLSHVPVTQQRVNTAAAHYDSQRFVSFTPLLSGTKTQVSQMFSLPAYGTADLVYTDGMWRTRGAVVRFAGVTMPEVSVTRQLPYGEFSTSYEFRYRVVGLGYRYKVFNIALASDSFSVRSARSAHFGMGYQYQF